MRKTIREYIAPTIGECISNIASPAIDVESFELTISFIHLVSQNHFGGLLSKNPNLHLASFLQLCDMLSIEE